MGPHYTETEQTGIEGSNDAGYKLDYVFTKLAAAAKQVQPGLPLDLETQQQTFQKVLERSRWTEILAPPDSLRTYLEVHDRATIFVNSVKRVPSDDMAELLISRFGYALLTKSASNILAFISPVLDAFEDTITDCFLELRRLAPYTESSYNATADLHSPANLVRLDRFLGSIKQVWSADSFKTEAGSGISCRVDTLIARVKSNKKISNSSPPISTFLGSVDKPASVNSGTLASQVAHLIKANS
jgi:hypothetical protein